jgi:hypothetical protein
MQSSYVESVFIQYLSYVSGIHSYVSKFNQELLLVKLITLH